MEPAIFNNDRYFFPKVVDIYFEFCCIMFKLLKEKKVLFSMFLIYIKLSFWPDDVIYDYKREFFPINNKNQALYRFYNTPHLF